MTVQIEFLGHASFLLTAGNHAVAIDPFLEGNPQASKSAGDIKAGSVVLTHGHADHFGPDALAIAKDNAATVYAPNELAGYVGEQGHEQIQPMNPGGRVEAPFGWVALTQAVHSSSYEGRYMGPACGAIVHIGGKTVYHMGDTALFSDLKLIGELYTPDLVIVPVGDRFTMGPEQGKTAAEWVGAKIAIPCHYGTWPVLESDISAFTPSGVEVRAIEPGATTEI